MWYLNETTSFFGFVLTDNVIVDFDKNGKVSSSDIKMKVSSVIYSKNKSGIEIEQNGLKCVEDYVKLENNLLKSDGSSNEEFGRVIINNYKYKFELKPNYVIANISQKISCRKMWFASRR